jgi:hypothetical protein
VAEKGGSLIDSRQKGKRGEREAAKYLRSLGFTSARRGVQYQGGHNSTDVRCEELAAVNIEVKYGVVGLDLGTKLLRDACAQAQQDAIGGTGMTHWQQPWCVLWKPKGAQQWRLTYPYVTGSMRVRTADQDGEIQNELRALQHGWVCPQVERKEAA